jgi:hypothetical protein
MSLAPAFPVHESLMRAIKIGSLVVWSVDWLLLLIWDRKTHSPFSTSLRQYFILRTDAFTKWAGRILLPLVLLFYVIPAWLTGSHNVAIPEVTTFIGSVLTRAFALLDNTLYESGILVLGVLGLVLTGVALRKALRPPPPSPAGRVVLPASRSSHLLYLVTNKNVEVLDRSQHGENGQLPIKKRFFVDAGKLEKIAVSHDLKKLFVTDSEKGVVHVILDEGQDDERKELPVGVSATSLTLSGDGRKLYVGIIGPIPLGKVEVFDVTKLERISSLAEMGCPMDLFATSMAPLVFVATQCGGGQDPLYVLDTRTDRVIARIPGLAVGHRVVATPRGDKAFVSTGNRLCVVSNFRSRTPSIDSIPMPASSLAITSDGKLLLVGTEGGIRSMDTRTQKWVNSVSLEAVPSEIAISPDGVVFAQLPARMFVVDVRSLM